MGIVYYNLFANYYFGHFLHKFWVDCFFLNVTMTVAMFDYLSSDDKKT